jgi:hypothetical protein
LSVDITTSPKNLENGVGVYSYNAVESSTIRFLSRQSRNVPMLAK